jgi:hypothetical protein
MTDYQASSELKKEARKILQEKGGWHCSEVNKLLGPDTHYDAFIERASIAFMQTLITGSGFRTNPAPANAQLAHNYAMVLWKEIARRRLQAQDEIS